MANKSENADIRELQTNMANLNQAFTEFKDKDFKEVKDDIKGLIQKFDNQASLQGEIDNLKVEIVELKAKRTFQTVIVPVICTILASLFTFLIINFFQHVQPSPAVNSTKTTIQK